MKKLESPTSQMQEVLYELINRTFIERRGMMFYCGVWNLTARISNLRDKGLKIISNEIKSFNKYNRNITFVQYSLEDKAEAVKIYKQMKLNSRPVEDEKTTS